MNEWNWISKSLEAIDLIAIQHRHADLILGRRFNLFQLIRSGHEEVSVHSRFLCALLDPNGAHGMGDSFLKAFIEDVVNPKANRAFPTDENYAVYPEKAMADGRMDLVIEAFQRRIVIENKIYAGDQPRQIERYVNHIQKEAPRIENRVVLYLTLWGSDPSKQSIGNVNDSEYCSISYQEDILRWLELCAIKAINKPYVRENISQYMDLIKQFTGYPEGNMKNEIKEYLLKNHDLMKLNQLSMLQKAVDELQNEKAAEFMQALECDLSSKGMPLIHKTDQPFTVENIRNVSKFRVCKEYLHTFQTASDSYISFSYWAEQSVQHYSKQNGYGHGFCAWLHLGKNLAVQKKERIENQLLSSGLSKNKDGVFDFHFKTSPIDLLHEFAWLDQRIFMSMVADVVIWTIKISETINSINQEST